MLEQFVTGSRKVDVLLQVECRFRITAVKIADLFYQTCVLLLYWGPFSDITVNEYELQ